MRKNRYVIAAFVIVIVPWSAFAAATGSTSSLKSNSGKDMRAQIIGGFLESAGCYRANAHCGRFTHLIAADDATNTLRFPVFSATTAASPCANRGCPQYPTQAQPQNTPGAPAIKIGNALLQNLPVLFALNALFSGASNGLLTPGPASLANIIILYQIFFAPNASVPIHSKERASTRAMRSSRGSGSSLSV